MRAFFRYYFFKVLLALIALQLVVFFWMEHRNHKPDAVNDNNDVYQHKTVALSVLYNDTDKNMDSIFINHVDSPMYGTLQFQEDIIYYKAPAAYVGVDSFRYNISDGEKTSNDAFITLKVMKNEPPRAKPDFITAVPGKNIYIPALGNDYDRENDSIKMFDFTQPAHGKVNWENNLFMYSPSNNSVPADSFYYVISDGNNITEKIPVNITYHSNTNSFKPWAASDIGITGAQGSVGVKSDKWTVLGSGADIWALSDQFYFIYKRISHDFEMIVRVDSVENTNDWAKAGIMARTDLTSGSKNIYQFMSAQNGVGFQVRKVPGEQTKSDNKKSETMPYRWLKLTKDGDVFNAYHSMDGNTWAETSSDTLAMPNNYFLGLAVTSHEEGKLCKAVLSNISFKNK